MPSNKRIVPNALIRSAPMTVSSSERIELSVLVPCFNEEANIPELIERLDKTFANGGLIGEVVLVDDGSSDRTWEVIQAEAARHAFITPVRHERNRGLTQAWRSALEASRGRLVCVIDADLQYQPEDILRLKSTLDQTDCDIVQGWRSLAGRKRDHRYYWSRGLNWILNRVFGTRLRDVKSGFVVCPTEILTDLMSFRGQYAYWQCFLMVAAHAKGYSYQEIETVFAERRAGTSFLANIPVKVIFRVLLDLVPAIREYRVSPMRRERARRYESVSRSNGVRSRGGE